MSLASHCKKRRRMPRALLAAIAAACLQVAAAEELTLQQAVSEALEKNMTLMAERANIGIAQARMLTASLRPNPVLSIGADHMDLLGTGFSEINGAGPLEHNWRTDFLIERGGKRQHRMEVAESARSVAEMQFLNSVRATVLDVQNVFVDVLLAKESLSLAQENLDSLDRIVKVNTERLRAGDLPEVELIRSRLAALQYANSVQRARLAVRTALTRLQTILGRTSISPSFDVAGKFRRDTQTAILAELRELALKSRPDLRALRRESRRAAAEVLSQIAQGKVDYTVGTEYRRQQGINGKGNSLGLFLSVPVPVFNRNQGEVERARREQTQIQWRTRGLEAEICGEVENAYQQVLTAKDLLENIETRMLDQARDVRGIMEYAYQRGDATLLELLDAQRAFNETMQAHNEARAEYARSLYLLDATSGRAAGR